MAERRPVGGHLPQISACDLVFRLRRRPVGLEIDNRDGVVGDEKPVDLARQRLNAAGGLSGGVFYWKTAENR